MDSTRNLQVGAFWAIGVASVTSAAFGHGMIPHDAPVDRIVQNLEVSLKDKPNDAELHYRLGRAHGLAFELKTDTVSVWDRKNDTEIAEKCWQWTKDKNAKAPSNAVLQTHLQEAIKHLNRAIELDAHASKYHLALASVLESGLPLADKMDVFPRCPLSFANQHVPEYVRKDVDDLGKTDEIRRLLASNWPEDDGSSIRDKVVSLLFEKLRDPDPKRAQAARHLLVEDWKNQIGDEYFTAMSLALPADSQLTQRPMWGSMECWIAYDAAKSYIRVIDGKIVTNPQPIRVATAKAAVKSFDALPRPNGITPIIFPVDGDRPLGALLAESASVRFDLDGSGQGQAWNWVRPDAGILVWDPTQSGKITSGRQLFGSVSWWIFFDNGYQALDALDDNRDGELTGDELKGIAVWIDRNGNGVSDPGEVTPIEQFGIRTIRVRATSTEDGCPANRDGIVMADGHVLPTYDWIATQAVPKRPLAMAFGEEGAQLWMLAGTPVVLTLASRRRRMARRALNPFAP